MPENGEKTTIGLIGKKASLHAQHTFFLHFCAVVLHNYNVKLSETSWLYASSGGNIVHVLVHFFFTIAHFKLVFSPLLQNFVFSSRKYVSFVFSLSLQLSFSSRFAGLSRYFLFLFSKFVDITILITQSLILQTTRIQKYFRFPFSSLLTLQFSLLHKMRVAIRFPTKIT